MKGFLIVSHNLKSNVGGGMRALASIKIFYISEWTSYFFDFELWSFFTLDKHEKNQLVVWIQTTQTIVYWLCQLQDTNI